MAQFRERSAAVADGPWHEVHGSGNSQPDDPDALQRSRKQRLENCGRLLPWSPRPLALRYDAGTEPTGGAQSSVAHRPFQGCNHRETEELSNNESGQAYEGLLESPWSWIPPSWPCEACLERPHTEGRDYWQSLGDAPEVQRYLQEKNGRRAGIASIVWTILCTYSAANECLFRQWMTIDTNDCRKVHLNAWGYANIVIESDMLSNDCTKAYIQLTDFWFA